MTHHDTVEPSARLPERMNCVTAAGADTPITDPGRNYSRDRLLRTYRRYAPLYDRLFGAVLDAGRRAMLEEVGRIKPGNVLEVGVGTGLTIGGYPDGTYLTGVDFSAEMLERARLRAAERDPSRIELRLMDAEQMDFPDGSFDCVTLPYVLSVTPDSRKLVHEVRRVCKRGGRIIILNHFSGSRFWWAVEHVLKSVADRVGFRSEFSFEDHVLRYDWRVDGVSSVNLLGLSKLVVITNV